MLFNVIDDAPNQPIAYDVACHLKNPFFGEAFSEKGSVSPTVILWAKNKEDAKNLSN